jgi:hypothetical protein
MKGIGNKIEFASLWALLIIAMLWIALVPLFLYLRWLNHGKAARADRASQLLMQGEEIVAAALQHRLFALIQRRKLLRI